MQKNQALFSSKDKGKKLKCRLLQFLFGALRVKICYGCYAVRVLVPLLSKQFQFRLCEAYYWLRNYISQHYNQKNYSFFFFLTIFFFLLFCIVSDVQ